MQDPDRYRTLDRLEAKKNTYLIEWPFGPELLEVENIEGCEYVLDLNAYRILRGSPADTWLNLRGRGA